MNSKHIWLTFLNEPKLILLHTVKRLQVLLCITNNSIKHQSFVYTQLINQTVLFQTIQFSINHLLALSLNVKQFYLTQDKTLFRGPGNDGNDRVLCISQRSCITGASPSNVLGHTLLVGVTPSAEIHLVYSTTPDKWVLLALSSYS